MDYVVKKNKRMNLSIFIEFISTFWKSVALTVGSWFAAYGLEPILLSLNVDIELIIKIIPAILTIAMAIFGFRWSLMKNREEAKTMEIERMHKIQDQYRENVNWLMERGYVNNLSTKLEIDEMLNEHFPNLKS